MTWRASSPALPTASADLATALINKRERESLKVLKEVKQAGSSAQRGVLRRTHVGARLLQPISDALEKHAIGRACAEMLRALGQQDAEVILATK